ncbi:M20/M25/M40 family metallo-hydrolase [Pseudokineococcus sp. 1T1Z-3]|uniref:M20/M25/M40 family metallo-hydrolase n=1 Tax=Pseudokineococcus sp. 1T1Z-3 TaxID=3132745 RepID=UPI0030A6CFF7
MSTTSATTSGPTTESDRAALDLTPAPGVPAAADEVVDIARDLIRIDTSNYGDGRGPGERAAADLVVGLLEEVGLAPEVFESDPGRASVVLRVPGADRSRGALVVHGHLDVVPAQAADWSVDPFAGEIKDGCLWGRGAVDMKGMDAMILSVVRQMTREGRTPPRDLVVAFFADEEAGGAKGARHLVDTRPDLFEGATEAISEVGGFSLDVAGQRCYLLQTAEKGIAWVRLVAHGRAGHGSQVNGDNAVTRLAAAVARIGEHAWPLEVRPSVQAFLEGVSDITGEPVDPEDFARLTDLLGTAANWVGATLRNTSNPTQLEAGYKHNVIPGTASALVDCRTLPDQADHVLDVLRELAGPGVDVEVLHQDRALETDLEGALPEAMVAAMLAEDPGARVLPYCLSGGTDNKSLARLGIRGFGFAPLQLPADLDFAGMFHGVDERVPTDALRFGTRVLDRLLRTC